MANAQWPDYVDSGILAPKRHTDEGSGATHRYTRPILSRTYRDNGRPPPLLGLAGTRFAGRVEKKGCEDVASSPKALLPTQAVLKSNTQRYQYLNDTPRVRQCILGEQGGT